MSSIQSVRHSNSWFGKIPHYLRILFAVGLGVLAGILFRSSIPGFFSDLGMLLIRILKALATPLIFFAVLDVFLTTHIPASKGLKMVGISAVNAIVAIVIGLGVANVLRTGEAWKGHLDKIEQTAATISHESKAGHSFLNSLVPESLVEPFQKNNIIMVVLVAILMGTSIRQIKQIAEGPTSEGIRMLEGIIHASFKTVSHMLCRIVNWLPIAIFFVVTSVVSKTGPEIFSVLLSFLFTMVLGLFIHAVLYYAVLLRVVAKVSPREFFKGAWEAIVTALSCSSSLATLPTTLRCLEEKLKVSPGSARLAACVGTNLNHDGIILYEAAAAIFLAQALGVDLTFTQQLGIAAVSIMGGIGVAGVPEAGLITLSLVLTSAGLPDFLVPLILPVDWIIGRCRAATNVISDMTVAVILDKMHPDTDTDNVSNASSMLG